MKHISLGGLDVSRLGLGAMSMSGYYNIGAGSDAESTKRVARVEENTAADRIELSAEQMERLNNLTPAAGERHDEGNMAIIDR